jgi:glycosyltransferase involved in cell wall biosynthesis/GT2 family glycosyltransferase
MANNSKSENMIPKKIHYCWFGGNPLPESAKRCIDSWKKFCPDYEIIEWNESNVDFNEHSFTREAYKSKKWAFISDYIRYKVIYENGGLYLDVDVEVVRKLDDLRMYKAFMGFEGREYVATGLGFGAIKGNETIKAIIDIYDGISFNAHKDKLSAIATPVVVTNFLKKKGLVQNGEFQTVDSITILPEDYLCPKNPITRLVNITDNTFSIHHYDASWVDDSERAIIDKLEEKGKVMSNKYPDLVSIIIPVYNGEDYLRKAIDSAVNQTYKNIEILVIDDGSSDRTESIALSYGPAVRYIRKENGGVASALNQGIKSMRGKYFSWLSHDDMYHSQKIELLMAQARKENLNTILVSDWDIVDSEDTLLKHSRLDNRLESAPRSFLAFDRKTWLNTCAMLIPKSLFDKVGLFDETLRTTQDYDMHDRLIKKGAKYKIVHKSLLLSRQHSKQGCLTENNVLQNSDLIHKSIVSDLEPSDIKEYFKADYSEISKVYNSFLSNGYKETPACIISSVIKASKVAGFDSKLIKIIQSNLVGPEVSNSMILATDIMDKVSKKSKKRLLFCSGFWRTGGMERVLANLFKDLNDDYDIFLLTPYDGNEGCIELSKGVTHIRVSSPLYYNHFDTVALSYAMMLDIDAVIGFLNLLDKQLDLYEQCENNGIRTIASNHEYYFYPYMSNDSNIRKLTEKRRKTFQGLDAVLWLTNFSTAIHNIQSDNGYLMPNPNTFEVKKGKLSIKNDKIVLCVGRYNDYVKKVDRIIESFGLVLKTVPDAKLMMVGAVDRYSKMSHLKNRSINDLLQENNITESSVNFIGETADIGKYYSMASLIMLTSMSEGFPMVLTEASCYGLPMVCNRVPGLEDIVIDGYNGYLASQGDIEALADSVCKVLTDEKLRLDMGANAKKYVSKFNSVDISKRWKLLIDIITSDKPKNERRHLLDKEMPFNKMGHRSLEVDMIEELNRIFNQSIEMDELIMVNDVDHIIGRRARAKRLLKLTALELKTKGPRSTFRKATKKIKNKLNIIKY